MTEDYDFAFKIRLIVVNTVPYRVFLVIVPVHIVVVGCNGAVMYEDIRLTVDFNVDIQRQAVKIIEYLLTDRLPNMLDLEVLNKLAEAEAIPDFSVPFTGNYELDQKIVEHKAWLKSIRHEQPSPKHHYRVGIYIRYFNQKNMTTTWSTTSGSTRISSNNFFPLFIPQVIERRDPLVSGKVRYNSVHDIGVFRCNIFFGCTTWSRGWDLNLTTSWL